MVDHMQLMAAGCGRHSHVHAHDDSSGCSSEQWLLAVHEFD
jgi:hypothetical protein